MRITQNTFQTSQEETKTTREEHHSKEGIRNQHKELRTTKRNQNFQHHSKQSWKHYIFYFLKYSHFGGKIK